jgi:acyl-CoA hydrolase
MSQSIAVKASVVLPPDTNHYGTIFGGRVMAYIDDVAAISAMRHARMSVVTASMDSVDFLHPIRNGQAVCLESFVTWTHKTSMEVFVRVVAEDLLAGERKVCATAFLTFVAIDRHGKPQAVPPVYPETELEKKLFDKGSVRSQRRKDRRSQSKDLALMFGVSKPWGE